jgi:uncharacterized membrane protein YeaQ/YmgE (transglycosylase-associated protein family)
VYAIAILGDIFGIIPFVNIVSDIITAIALGIVGSASGVNIYASDEIGATLFTGLIEAVPGASIIPAWTMRVYFAKKKAKAKKAKAEQQN